MGPMMLNITSPISMGDKREELRMSSPCIISIYA